MPSILPSLTQSQMSPSLLSMILLLAVSLVPLVYILRATLSWRKHHKIDQKLLPGPRALPIIGNLHLLGNLPHQALYHLAKKYGHIMSMRLGNIPTIVVSSPQAAELFLKTHDTIFASRPKVQASLHMCYGTKGMAFTEYGPYWRNVRKLCTLKLLSASKIESFAPLRREELVLLVDSLKGSAEVHEVVDFTTRVGDFIEKMTCRMLFGQTNNNGLDLKPLIKESLYLAGAFNIADYVPFLGPLDLQGLTRRMKTFSSTMDKVFEKIIDEHEEDASKDQERDFIDVLLSWMNQHPNNSLEGQAYVIDRTNIKAILIDMIAGSFDTSATTIDWIVSELLRHPRVMKCVQEELESVVGMKRMVEEKDLPKLTYLEMVIKESLRLHPIVPLLVPRESMEAVMVDGYYIPKKTRVIVNAWAIGRDSTTWSDNAEEFFPERFVDKNVDLRGQDFQLIPFGSGRRGCPGMYLGLTVVRLAVAQLLHCFSWELPDGMLSSNLDMSETFGLAMPRSSHLFAVPKYRLLC